MGSFGCNEFKEVGGLRRVTRGYMKKQWITRGYRGLQWVTGG